MNWLEYLFGPNSLWADFCQLIGKPEWIYVIEHDEPDVPPDVPPDEPPEPPKPPNYPRIPVADRYSKTRFWWTPFLIPTLGINNIISNQDYIRFLNRIVNNGWGNGLRIFSKGMWERHWLNKLNFPFVRNVNDRFLLNKTNLGWLNSLLFRLDAVIIRGVFPIVTIEDNCSLHERRSGFWSEHWMNGFNNANGTSPWMPSIYHYYEEEWHDADYVREFNSKRRLAGLPENPTNQDINRWIAMLDTTGRLVEEFNDYLVSVLDATFGNNVGIEVVNEGMAGDKWHKIQLDLLENHNIPKVRRFTSISPDQRFDDFYGKNTIKTSFIPSVHSIGNITDYLNRRQICSVPFIASADGTKPPENKDDWRVLASRVKQDGLPGFEGNLRPIFELQGGRWENVCGDEDWTLTSMKWGWANAVRDGING